MKSIFVGNLAWATTNEDLEAKFSEFGQVTSARIINDKMTGKSRGFGFVDMDDEGAAKAIEAISGKEWNGREITCNEAKPKTDRPRRDRF